MATTPFVKKILDDIDRYDGSVKAFAAIVAQYLEAGTDPEEQARKLAARVECAPSTVKRWTRGISKPHHRIRPTYLKDIRDILTTP